MSYNPTPATTTINLSGSGVILAASGTFFHTGSNGATTILSITGNMANYVEDWQRTTPDFFNSWSQTGDPSNDFVPAVRRFNASYFASQSLYPNLDMTAGGYFKRIVYPRTLLFGRDHQTYNFSKQLDIFGMQLEGCWNPITQGYGVILKFVSASNGIVGHYPFYANGGGTYLTGVALDDPAWGHGGAMSLVNIQVQGGISNGYTGTIGIQPHWNFQARNTTVKDFGYNGFHIYGSVVDDRWKSNCNGWYMDRCVAVGCGKNPGTGSGDYGDSWVTVANPSGNRPYGSGLYIDGPDSNAGMSTRFSGYVCGYWSIWDSSFLGNTHIGGDCDTNRHSIQQWELDIFNHPSASTGELEAFNTYNYNVGDTVDFGYKGISNNARNVFINMYTEGAGLIDVQSPSQKINGIGGLVKTHPSVMAEILGNVMKGFQAVGSGSENQVLTLNLANQSNNEFLAFASDHDKHPGGVSRLYKFKYIPMTRGSDGQVSGTQASQAGFYKWDHADSSARIPYMLTGEESSGSAPNIRALDAGKMVLFNHYVGGQASYPVEYATAKPAATATGSNYPIGSIVWNTAPAPGEWMGWVRVLGTGSNQQWNGFGAIES